MKIVKVQRQECADLIGAGVAVMTESDDTAVAITANLLLNICKPVRRLHAGGVIDPRNALYCAQLSSNTIRDTPSTSSRRSGEDHKFLLTEVSIDGER